MATNGYHGYHVNVTQFIESSLKHTARSKGKRPDTIWCSREDHSNMSWIMHCSPASFLCAGSAFPADGVVTKLRLNKGTQQVAGTWSQHTLALLGKAEASLPTHTCALNDLLHHLTYFWSFASLYTWSQYWCHQQVADLGILLLSVWMWHDPCFINI